MDSELHKDVLDIYKIKLLANRHLVNMCFVIIIMFLVLSKTLYLSIFTFVCFLIFNLFSYIKGSYLKSKVNGELYELEGKALEVIERKNKLIVKVLLELETVNLIKENNIEMYITKDNTIELNLFSLAHVKFIDIDFIKETNKEVYVSFIYSSKGKYVLDFELKENKVDVGGN